MSFYRFSKKETLVVKKESVDLFGSGKCKFWAVYRVDTGRIVALFKHYHDATRYIDIIGKPSHGECAGVMVTAKLKVSDPS